MFTRGAKTFELQHTAKIGGYVNVTERLDLREAWIITKVSIIPGFKSRFMRTTLRKLEFLLNQLRFVMMQLYRTCLLAWAGVLGLLLSYDNTGWRRVIWRATRSFIMEWRACLSSEEDNGLGKTHS